MLYKPFGKFTWTTDDIISDISNFNPDIYNSSTNLPRLVNMSFHFLIIVWPIHLALSAFDTHLNKGKKEIKHYNLQPGDYIY